MRAPYGHRLQRNVRFLRKYKAPLFELQKPSVGFSPCSFREDDNAFALADLIGGIEHGLQSFLSIVPFHGDIASRTHGPAHDWNLEQRCLGHPAKLNCHIQEMIEHSNIEHALMIA